MIRLLKLICYEICLPLLQAISKYSMLFCKPWIQHRDICCSSLLIFLFNIIAKCWKFYFCCCSVIVCPTFCHRLQHARLPWPSLSPRVCPNSCPFSWQYYLTIPSSTTLFSFSFSLSQNQGLFQWVRSLHHMVKVLELQLQHQSVQWIFSNNFL